MHTVLCCSIGYPVLTYINHEPYDFIDLGGISQVSFWSSFVCLIIIKRVQLPSIGNFGLIDKDTPKDAHRKPSYRDGSDWQLVFSDEFNTDGRSFYRGDDPYWEAADLHYWVSSNTSACFHYRVPDVASPRQLTTWNGMTRKQ
jgi:hypothetical protein